MKRHQISLGIIKNSLGQILLAERPSGKHLSGYWEFPGGKVESGESFKMTLRRELLEEIDINVEAVKKIFEYRYRYPDRELHFQVFEVLKYSNEVKALESQNFQWVNECDIHKQKLPPANIALMNALKLPDLYMITYYRANKEELYAYVKSQLLAGVSLVQFRAPQLNKSQYITQAVELCNLCDEYGGKLISNCELSWVDEIQPHGVHLSSARLQEASQHSDSGYYFSASCHDEREIMLANQLNVDCVLVGAVNVTRSHPDNLALGWNNFQRLCGLANIPVYALGGLVKDDLMRAKLSGAQGVAGIRLFQD